jgi:hypothetical protein
MRVYNEKRNPPEDDLRRIFRIFIGFQDFKGLEGVFQFWAEGDTR